MPRYVIINRCLTTSEWPTNLHCRDRYDTVTQNQNNCAETYLGDGDTNAFVVPSAAIARLRSSTLAASTVLRRPHKDSDHTAAIAIVH